MVGMEHVLFVGVNVWEKEMNVRTQSTNDTSRKDT